MAQMLDALVLELQLNADKFVKGQKDAIESFKKTKDEAVKTGKAIEEQTTKTADSVTGLAREFQGLFGLLAGALGANAIKGFIEHLATADSALGRLAANLGMQPQALGAWGLAVERIGGNAQSAMESVRGLNDKLQGLRLMGKPLPQEMSVLSAHGGIPIDLQNRGVDQTVLDIVKNLQSVSAKEGRPVASWLGRSIGLDDNFVNLVLDKGPQLLQMLEEVKKVAATDKDIQAAQKLQEAWAGLLQSVNDFFRKIVTDVSPQLKDMLKTVTSFVDRLKEGFQVWSKKDGNASTGGEMVRDPNQGFWDKVWHGRRYIPGDGSAPSSSPVRDWLNRRLGRGSMMGYAEDQLRKEGVPESNLRGAAAQLVGQADMESGLDPNKDHDGGTGFGIYGARLDRRAKMFAWLDANGYARNSAEGQMRYMAHEAMSGGYPTTRSILLGGSTNGVDAITREFENPAIINDRRAAVSRAYAAGGSGLANQGFRSAWAGAGLSAAASSPASSFSNSRSDWNINGPITIHTQATDADGIARALPSALERNSFAQSANDGAH